MSSSVLFERTLAMRQGIHSLADFRVSAGRFHSHENQAFDSCSAKNAYPPTDDFTGFSDMGATTGGLPLGRMKPPCG
ncbi:hypothetical protein QUA62_25415 [Microcoleus sp. MON1_C1]|uniref:hypothetical protein n=1 Tax=Microcoleus sp. MON1_C1 TaxID=2818827 RepID=UPI002FCE8A22